MDTIIKRRTNKMVDLNELNILPYLHRKTNITGLNYYKDFDGKYPHNNGNSKFFVINCQIVNIRPEYNEIKNEKENQNWDELCLHVIPQPQSGMECFELFSYKYPPFNENYTFILTVPLSFLSYTIKNTMCHPNPGPNTQSIVRPQPPQQHLVQLQPQCNVKPQPQPTVAPQSRIIEFIYPQPIAINFMNLITYV